MCTCSSVAEYTNQIAKMCSCFLSFLVFLKMSHMFACFCVSRGMRLMPLFHTECREAGEPVAHERVQDEGAGLRRPTEDGGEGAERGPPPCSSLSVKGQNSGQGHTGHPGARSCKEPNGFSSSSSSTLTCAVFTVFLALMSYSKFTFRCGCWKFYNICILLLNECRSSSTQIIN